MNTQIQTIKAKSFLGLMAAEGLVPGATAAKEVPEEFFNKLDREIADITAPGSDFFSLMVAAGQMKTVAEMEAPELASAPVLSIVSSQDLPKVKRNLSMFRITRPYHLGGDMPHAA